MIAAVLAALCLLGATEAPPPVQAGGEAERLFQQGLKAYDAREFTRAIAAFEAAYQLTPMPEILFDIGMAHRALGDCRLAAKSFDDFIRAAAPGDPLLSRARERRAELASCAASAPADEAAGSPASGAPRGAPPESPVHPLAAGSASVPAIDARAATPVATHVGTEPTSVRRSRLWRDACAVSLGSTGVLAAAGLVFGWQARSAQQEVENTNIWDESTIRADQRGRTFGDASLGLLLSAGATALLAATTCFVAHRQH